MPKALEPRHSVQELRAAGNSATDVRKGAGFTAVQHWGAQGPAVWSGEGILGAAVQHRGAQGPAVWSDEEILGAGFPAQDLRAAGYTFSQLLQAGYEDASILSAGFPAAELVRVERNIQHERSLQLLPQSPVDVVARPRLGTQRAPAVQHRGPLVPRYSMQQLQVAGYSAKDLREAVNSLESWHGDVPGWSDVDILHAGFRAESLRAARYTCVQLLQAGYPDLDVLDVGQ